MASQQTLPLRQSVYQIAAEVLWIPCLNPFEPCDASQLRLDLGSFLFSLAHGLDQ
jgi:hypothetical protein